MMEKKKVAFVSVLAAAGLTAMKLTVGISTGSLGILSEALHSGLDLVAAVITLMAVRISDKPANRIFNFGHGKVENFSALAETLLLLITCLWIVYEAFNRLISGNTHIEVTIWSYLVVIISIVVDMTRSRALYRVARRYRSQALEADALHFSTDILSSLVVLTGLICAGSGLFFADSLAALVVAGIVLVISWRLGRRAVDVLLDKAPAATAEAVRRVLADYREIRQYHGLKVRTAGADTFIRVNIHLDPDLKLGEVHDLCDRIEKKLGEVIPRCQADIHAEPQEYRHLLDDLASENRG